MKKIFLITISVFSLYSCVDEDINNDPNSAYTTAPESLLSYAQKELSYYLNTPNVNVNNFRLAMQYWQEVTYVNESNYDFTNRNVSNTIWETNYGNILNNLNKAKGLINEYKPSATEQATWNVKKKNQLAIIDIMMVFVYQNLVDTFGDIPYSQALDIEKYPLPVYDNDVVIYEKLISRLTTDIGNLISGPSFGSGDYFYQGDITKWRKFGNSLLLKLGITIADANVSLAKSTVNQALVGGVISSSSDNCVLTYQTSSPNYNPLYENLAASGRDDFFAGKTLIDYMNATNDSRISAYYKLVPSTKTYIGAPIGASGDFDTFSHIGDFAYKPNTPGIIMSFTEITFYLAEVAARWNTTATAQSAYIIAVSSSFFDWGFTPEQAATYLIQHPYDPANWKKSIGEQAWVAMYNQPIVSWTFYRRMDFPILKAPPTAIANAQGKVPVRMQYPVKESTTNPTNWQAASTAIGGDKLTTKIFWDKF